MALDADETYIDEYRINAIVDSVKRRLQNLEKVIEMRLTDSFIPNRTSTVDDVEENIASDYSQHTKL